MTVTAYRDLINYTFPQALWIAETIGAWKSWFCAAEKGHPAVRRAATMKGTSTLQILLLQFKMVKGNDWSAGDYGNCGGANSPVEPPVGTNFSLEAGAGIYLLRANTNALTRNSATKITTQEVLSVAWWLGIQHAHDQCWFRYPDITTTDRWRTEELKFQGQR